MSRTPSVLVTVMKLGLSVLVSALVLLGIGKPLYGQGNSVKIVTVDSINVRPVFHKLWKESAKANKELIACIGGYRDKNIFKITKAADLHSLIYRPDSTWRNSEFDADSMSVSHSLSQASVEKCRPPEWIGTIHTHRTEGGAEYPHLSSGDRAVISLWHERWRHESVFCVLFSYDRPPYCEYKEGA